MCDYSNLVKHLHNLTYAERMTWRKSFPDLSPTQFGIIAMLYKKQSVKVGELAEKLRVDQSVASRSLKSLQEKDFVNRSVDSQDTRAARFALSDKGKAALVKGRQESAKQLESIISDWSEEKVALATDILQELSEKMLQKVWQEGEGQ